MGSPEYTNLNNGHRKNQRNRPPKKPSSNHNHNDHASTAASMAGGSGMSISNHHHLNGIDPNTAAALTDIAPSEVPQSCVQQCCGCKYNPSKERLNYDFSKDDNHHDPTNPNSNGNANGISGKGTKGKKLKQPLPRIRQRGEYYIDSYNGESWSCAFGTNEEAGIWMNSGDQAGSVMAVLVWLLLIYSAVTVTSLTITEGISPILGMIYNGLVCLALASHAKTSLTDPGSVPKNAVPLESQRRDSTSHSMCGQCQTFKPPMSHHCRICNRCVSRMDHHCPWMNNCVGAANLKHFFLFLIYTWTCSAYALTLFGWNYFFCADEDCTFHAVVVHLVRVMTVLGFGAFLFTSSMLMNVTYGLMTGIGTIDRLKKKATNTMGQSDEEPILLTDVFGVGGFYTWPFPIDPVFEDYDEIMGFSTPQRLAREQNLMELAMQTPNKNKRGGDIELPDCVTDFLPV